MSASSSIQLFCKSLSKQTRLVSWISILKHKARCFSCGIYEGQCSFQQVGYCEICFNIVPWPVKYGTGFLHKQKPPGREPARVTFNCTASCLWIMWVLTALSHMPFLLTGTWSEVWKALSKVIAISLQKIARK